MVNAAASDIETDARSFALDQAPGFLFRQLESRATTLFTELTEQSEITPRQFGVLLTLFQNGLLLQTELGKRMRVDRSTLGEMLQRMFERGLIERSSWPADRRVMRIGITQAGRDVLLMTVAAARKSQAMLLEPLPPNQRAIFLKHLSTLAAAWHPTTKDEEP